MGAERTVAQAPASRPRRHHLARGLAEIALRAGGQEVVLVCGAAGCEGNRMVEVQHDAGLSGGTTAVPAAEAVAQ